MALAQLPSLPSPVLAGSSLERPKASQNWGRCFVLIGGGGEGEERESVTGGEEQRWEEKQRNGAISSAFVPRLADTVSKGGSNWFIWEG